MSAPEGADRRPEPAAARQRAVLYGGVALLAALARGLYLAPLSLLVTHDSPSYIAIARRLAQLDAGHPRLGDTRMPGYPLFLALLDRLGNLDAPGILVAQAVLGVATALLAAWIGGRLAGHAGALGFGFATALFPVSIVDEHSVMAETLGRFFGLATAAAAIHCTRRPRVAAFAALGALGAAAALVRLNLLLLAPVAVAVLLLARRRDGGAARWRLAAAAGLSFATVLLPWLVFSAERAHALTLNPGDCRLRLLYLGEWGLVARDLPAFAPYRGLYDPARPETALAVDAELKKLPVAQSRALACEVAAASERAAPARLLRARSATLAAFFGWEERLPVPAEASTLRHLFRNVFGSPESIGATPLGNESHRLDAMTTGRTTTATRLLCRAGLFYLDGLRRPLLVAAIVAGWLLVIRWIRTPDPPAAVRLGAAFTAGWFGTALLHAWRLAWSDRFSVQLDWLALAVLVAAFGAWMHARARLAPAIG